MLLWDFHSLVGKFLLRKAVSGLGYPEFSKHLFFFNEHLGGLSGNYSVETGRWGSQDPAVGISSKGWSLAGFEWMASSGSRRDVEFSCPDSTISAENMLLL